MKKKNIKPLIMSSLASLALGAVGTVGTFALFTDKAETKVEIGSGVVKVESQASLINYSSSVDGTDHDFESAETSYSNPKVGNSFSIDGSVITIDKMVPGDKLTVKLTAVNKSNVKTLTRFMISHALVGAKQDLFPALKFSFNAGELTPADVFRWQTNDAVSNTEGVNLYGNDGLTMTIELPDSHDGQITFDGDNLDNMYQDHACSIALNLQAVQGNAQVNPIDEINGYLAAETLFEGQNKTMHDAVLDMAEIEYESLAVLEDYVYDLANDQFVKEEGISADYHKYFKVCDEMPDPQKFSVYASPSWSVGNVSLSGIGFDAGDTTGISTILYEGVDVAREVTIRTNTAQTSLTVDAPLDTIHHYDALGALNIVQSATNSYHEFGSIAFAEIAKGRIVLEQGSDVNQIHINKKTESSFDTVIIANNGGADELPEKITRDAVTVEEETLVVKVESKGVSENVYVYADGVTGTKGSTEKVTEGANKQNENVETALGQLVLDNGSEADKAQTVQEKSAAKEEAVEEAIAKETYKGDVYILQNGAAEDSGVYATLAEFRNAVNAGTTYNGYTVTLQCNIDLEGNEWTPIGNSVNTPFMGTFDGGNCTINGLTIDNENAYQGLFGYVADATIQNLKMTNASVSVAGDSGIVVGGVKDLNQARTVTFNNCHVLSGTIEATYDIIGGLCGRIHDGAGAAIFNNCSNNAIVIAHGDSYRAGGILGACGSTSLTMNSCSNAGTINSIYAGGLLGATRGLAQGGTFAFNNCVNTGTLSGDFAGKFIGFVNSSAAGSDYLTVSINNEDTVSNLFGVWQSGGTEGGILTVNLGEDLYKYLLIPTYTYSLTEGKIVSLSKVNNVAHPLCDQEVVEAASNQWQDLMDLNPKAAIYNEDGTYNGVSPTTNCFAPNNYYIKGADLGGFVNTWVKILTSIAI